MSHTNPVNLVEPLGIYDGPTEAYAIDPAEPYRTRGGPTSHFILTSLIVDDHDYDDAIRVYVDGIEKGQPFFLNIDNARALIEMLERDILKLERIRLVDPL